MGKANLTDVVAWWGAIVATLVLLWDVYKWSRSGPDVRVEATPSMKVFPKLPHTGDTTFIFVAATNHGAQSTTITHLAGVHYPSLWHKLARRGAQHFVVFNNALGSAFPHVVGPGERWTGAIDQDDATTKYGKGGLFYCGVFHSRSRKPIYSRVLLK